MYIDFCKIIYLSDKYDDNIKKIYSHDDIGYIAVTYDNNIIFMTMTPYNEQINEIKLNYNA